ncbi:hypothetical protein IM282_15610 [Enterobacter cloacae complex sp. P29RS]|nr:hypothetical protein [Enterobacter cloacae complex sp. P29RS]
MQETISLNITSANHITKGKPYFSRYLGKYIDEGYLTYFECVSPVDETDTYESISEYFDVVGDFECEVNIKDGKCYLTGSCVLMFGEPVRGIHQVPIEPEYLVDELKCGEYRLSCEQ